MTTALGKAQAILPKEEDEEAKGKAGSNSKYIPLFTS